MFDIHQSPENPNPTWFVLRDEYCQNQVRTTLREGPMTHDKAVDYCAMAERAGRHAENSNTFFVYYILAEENYYAYIESNPLGVWLSTERPTAEQLPTKPFEEYPF